MRVSSSLQLTPYPRRTEPGAFVQPTAYNEDSEDRSERVFVSRCIQRPLFAYTYMKRFVFVFVMQM
ncbi:hypothetical protein BDW22DRAFT_1353853 [Trametopsis cervina]|nr:hypothetical protein BDW22DRAFT_1353853 [Trametopsis cervina]